MKQINFLDVKGSSSVIMDLTSLQRFFGKTNLSGMEFLISTRGAVEEHFRVRGELRSGENLDEDLISSVFCRPFELLELFVVHDNIVVDAEAFETDEHHFSDPAIKFFLAQDPFVACKMPVALRRDAHSKWNEGTEKFHCFWKDFYVSPYWDQISASAKLGGRFLPQVRVEDYSSLNFFDLNCDNAFRSFYYLSVAEATGRPLIISPEKQRAISKLQKHCLQRIGGLHEYFSKIALESSESQWLSYRAPLPPVQEMILSQWLKDEVTPWEVALKIRNSEEARAYRALLLKLTTLSQGNLSYRNEAAREIEKIKTLMSEWKQAGDISKGGRRWRHINLQKVPTIGWIAAAFNLFEKVRIPDFSLAPPQLGEVFMSEWFENGRQR